MYTICLYDHIGQCTRILYAYISLHWAMQCLMEFKHVPDLWTGLNMILT